MRSFGDYRSVAEGLATLTDGLISGCVPIMAQVQLPQFRRAGLDVTAIASRSQDSAITLAATVCDGLNGN